MNRLQKKSRLSVGTNLLIPLPKEKEIKPGPLAPKPSVEKGRPSGSEEITYIIKKGDTLWSIANEMGVNIGALSSWNKLHPEKKLMPGDQLKIRVAMGENLSEASQNEKGKKEIIYVVKTGDSLWSIASKHNVSISEIKNWNNLDGNDRIYPSERLKLKVGSPKS
jgi:membrane-bound lytic murein transglycosylase D